jgi:uncharacterized LabA/DUF88 family protein
MDIMNLEQFQKDSIKNDLGIDESWGRIFSFIDFGNVDFWFEKDTKDTDGNILDINQKNVINLERLAGFSQIFSIKSRFYFGVDINNKKSVGFIDASRRYFDSTITKPVQMIKHYLDDKEIQLNNISMNGDEGGSFVYIPKCNFDVEICVDAIRLIDNYDVFCLFSSDADFINLIKFIKRKNKKVVLIKSGFVKKGLVDLADIVINAQDIKKYITMIKQKSSQS